MSTEYRTQGAESPSINWKHNKHFPGAEALSVADHVHVDVAVAPARDKVVAVGEALHGEVTGVEQLAGLPRLHPHARRQDLPGLQARQDLQYSSCKVWPRTALLILHNFLQDLPPQIDYIQ